ncbi:MAG: heme ABC exporter ATP-binding protein CcmA [Hyphomonadaceae bacterium]|nr:heme ABC exporter ATP-binding protein CcmA [Hyphomonadaceae bacterium]
MVVAPASSLVLEVENLAAVRGLRVLFEGLSLRVSGGEALELRGPNGSGKSTLLRILAGLTRQHAGTVTYSADEHDAPHHYLGHADAVKPTESAGEQARFWASYFGRPAITATDALARVGLSQRTEVPGRGLSAGQKRRLALSRLLIDPRPVWLLDEPTAALDIEGRKLVVDLVAEHRATGGMVIAAIHGDGFVNSNTLDLSKLKAPANLEGLA